jgi:hypothetical protein
MIGNIISGLIGGGVLGQIVTLLLPAIQAAAQSGNLSIGGIISQAIAGGAGGAILTAIIGAIKNRAAAGRADRRGQDWLFSESKLDRTSLSFPATNEHRAFRAQGGTHASHRRCRNHHARSHHPSCRDEPGLRPWRGQPFRPTQGKRWARSHVRSADASWRPVCEEDQGTWDVLLELHSGHGYRFHPILFGKLLLRRQSAVTSMLG